MRAVKLKQVFLGALAVPPGDRDAYIKTACDGNQALIREVKSLIARDSDSSALRSDQLWSIVDHVPADTGPAVSNGERIGDYEIVSVLGVGGTSTVYAATRPGLDAPVALKLLQRTAPSERERWRFEHEVRLLSRLDHPGLTRVRDFGVDAISRPFIVMDLVVGLPFAAATRKLPRRDALNLLIAVCEAVQHAHQRGVIHRDLKSANVLVTPATPNEPSRAVVVDFGIARAHDHLAAQATLPGVVLGTLGTMAPEQARGDSAAIDTRTDVWGLGVLLFEHLTGRLPLGSPGKSPGELASWLHSAQCEEPRRARALAPDTPPDLDAIAARALAPSPPDRYASPSELADDLRRFLDGRPTIARPPKALELALQWTRRHRVAVVLVSAGALLLTTAAVSAVSAWRADRREYARSIENYAFLLDRLVDDAAKRAATRDFRARIVNEALQRIENDVLRKPNDPDLRALRGKALQHAAEIAAQSGDFESMRDLYRRSLEDRQFLAECRPNDPRAQLELATQIVRVGDRAIPDEKPSKLERYRAAHEMYLAIARDNPDFISAHTSLGWSFERLAHQSRGIDPGTHLTLLEQRAILARDLVTRFPANPEVLYNLAEAEALLSSCFEPYSEDHLCFAQSALTAAERMFAVAPEDRRSVHAYARALARIAGCELLAGHDAKAQTLADRATAVVHPIWEADPDDHFARWTMRDTTGRQMQVAIARRDFTAALAAANETIAVLERCFAIDASDPQVHTDLQNYRNHRDHILANIRAASPTQ